MKNTKQNIKLYIIICSLLTCIIAFCFHLFIQHIQVITKEETKNHINEVATQNAYSVQQLLDGDITSLQLISSLLSQKIHFSLPDLQVFLTKQVEKNDFDRMGIILPNGQAYTSDKLEANLSDREYFKKSLQGENVITDPLISRFDGKKSIIFSVPIRAKGKVAAVLYATHQCNKLVDSLSIPTFNGQGFSYITSAKGNVILQTNHPNSDRKMKNIFSNLKEVKHSNSSLKDFKNNLKNGKSGVDVFSKYGQERYISYQPIKNTNDWFVISVVPSEVVQAKSAAIVRWVFLLCFVIISCFMAIVIYISYSRYTHNKKVYQLAYTDQITGIGNNNYFIEHGNQIIQQNVEKKFAIVLFDINKFKIINEKLGHSNGNIILTNIAKIVAYKLQNNALYARYSDDNFIMLLPYEDIEKDVIDVIRYFQKEINNIRISSEEKLNLLISVGIYLLQPTDQEINYAIDKAIIAKTTAKGNVIQNYAFYKEITGANLLKENWIEIHMQDSFEREEFEVYLQPKVNSITNETVGAEALIRWNHPKYGLIPPNVFIPTFEKNGFITKIDEYVLEKVCEKLSEWKTKYNTTIKVSFNISRVLLSNYEFLWKLHSTVKKHNISPAQLELEITESIFSDNTDHMLQIFKKIRQLGYSIAMDDFGTGYSTLNLLHQLPFNTLKIDQSFLSWGTDTKRGRILLQNIINLAHDLQLEVVAEGVETDEHLQFLMDNDCFICQGYYYSKPIPVEEFEELYMGI